MLVQRLRRWPNINTPLGLAYWFVLLGVCDHPPVNCTSVAAPLVIFNRFCQHLTDGDADRNAAKMR